MKTEHSFKAVINSATEAAPGSTFRSTSRKTFGKKRVPIHATIDGVPYRGSLVRMGGDCHMLPVLKAIREKIARQAGGKVSVTLRADKAPRKVKVPADIQEALRLKPKAASFFTKLSYSHQREYIQWIEGAKRDETRERRIARILAMLIRGERER